MAGRQSFELHKVGSIPPTPTNGEHYAGIKE